ncbi:uncharacterized protein [Macrobrachium rosenbergii]|uniref:uncharacterized protein isoform X1 n=1 Tax=Macrobrachium rosenbergii TaxID=79674 RepID=UPI0034D3B135
MVRVHQPPGGNTHLNDELPKVPLNVRVQQPPGGKTHIDEELAPEQPKVRVLKPPGGGSSISFGEEDNLSHRGNSTPVEEAPKNDNQEQQSPKAETNGTSSPPQTPKENGTNSVTENSPSTATNTATTNGVALNGTVTNGTTSGSSTPNSSRLDTQSRLFGEEPQKMSSRRVRDHHRSNIFSDSDENVPSKSVYRRPWTRRDPVTGVGVLCWDLHAPRFAPIKRKANPIGNETPEPKTPEVKTPEQPQPQIQQQQRQRVPPGGFSSKLW